MLTASILLSCEKQGCFPLKKAFKNAKSGNSYNAICRKTMATICDMYEKK